MTDYVDYYDAEIGMQMRRPCTIEEQDEIDARRAKGIDIVIFNSPIIEKLEEIDRKSIRALREGNSNRIASLEAEAIQLRAQLRK